MLRIVLKFMLYLCRMNIENTNAQMRKGVLELCILLIVQQREAYASDILEVLKKHRMIVVEGTLYPLLTRLKNDGYLEYYWEESKSGPPRKYYKITLLGEHFLAEMLKSWNELQQIVSTLMTGQIKPE
jgi:PadR family transcriptional regulator, regulatory protein PadR